MDSILDLIDTSKIDVSKVSPIREDVCRQHKGYGEFSSRIWKYVRCTRQRCEDCVDGCARRSMAAEWDEKTIFKMFLDNHSRDFNLFLNEVNLNELCIPVSGKIPDNLQELHRRDLFCPKCLGHNAHIYNIDSVSYVSSSSKITLEIACNDCMATTEVEVDGEYYRSVSTVINSINSILTWDRNNASTYNLNNSWTPIKPSFDYKTTIGTPKYNYDMVCGGVVTYKKD